MKKAFVCACAVCVAVLLAAVVYKDTIARTMWTRGLQAVFPGNVRVSKAQAVLTRASTRLCDIRLGNPPGWECESDPEILKVSSLDVDFSWKSLLLRQYTLPRVVLSIDELRLIRNPRGELNIRFLGIFDDSSVAGQPQVHIGLLDLEIRRIVYKDYTRTPPQLVSFNAGIRERFEGITDIRMFSRELLTRVLAHAGLRTMMEAALGGTVTDATRSTVCFPQGCVNAEVASTDEARRTGLMGRQRLEEGEGMLFVFPEAGEHRFWMKNMLFPIDLIWIAADGTVLAVTQNAEPCRGTACASFSADRRAQFVLEVPAGYAGRNSIKAADTARMTGIR